MSDLVDLLDTSHFQNGLLLGLLALAVGWMLSLAFGRKRPPLPIGGFLITAATFGALHLAEEPLNSAVPALVLVAIGSLATRLLEMPRWVQPFAVMPGAVWLAVDTAGTELQWVRVLMMVLIPLGGFLISDFELRHDRMGLGVVFLTLAVLGVFAAVPDTEEALVLMAAAVPITLLAWPRVRISLGSEGAYLAVATFLWVAAAGGGGRPASIVGASACLGLLLLEPIVVAVNPLAIKVMTWLTNSPAGAVVASIPQVLLVFVCSRFAARLTQEPLALLVVIVAYGATIVIGWKASTSNLDSRRSAT